MSTREGNVFSHVCHSVSRRSPFHDALEAILWCNRTAPHPISYYPPVPQTIRNLTQESPVSGETPSPPPIVHTHTSYSTTPGYARNSQPSVWCEGEREYWKAVLSVLVLPHLIYTSTTIIRSQKLQFDSHFCNKYLMGQHYYKVRVPFLI